MGIARTTARLVLGGFLVFAGLSHLFWAREEFQAQVPSWMPIDEDAVVLVSGVVEVGLGAALILATRRLPLVGWIVAGFFVAVFPGNIAQYVDGVDAFGLDTDRARLIRLFFQPVLVLWALVSTGAWPRRRT
ncbi:DoxX family membrane protein [Nocardioides sp. R-C-SC26]|uniref:DoxX family protein n=1 Tax=Nocardioides sp. R-C-SC26 TaxID=2870414 RepID=UPI001E3A90D4|nr:DoxX family membrane protein [Nocardioides sp. R-C-SC26]